MARIVGRSPEKFVILNKLIVTGFRMSSGPRSILSPQREEFHSKEVFMYIGGGHMGNARELWWHFLQLCQKTSLVATVRAIHSRDRRGTE